ncbi:MAG: hypothetical protein JWO12_2650 [Frankiales bacterium]|nr:hypothetical protein [Frankiales bacterium]
MNRRVLQAVTATFVAGATAFGFAPLAYGSSDITITPSTEAWYQPNPTCLTPAGCVTTGSLPAAPPAGVPSPPAANPFPTGTLHVGVSAGTETARTYLRMPFEQLDGKSVTAANLEVPLDVAPQDGSTAPDTAKVAICETSSSNIAASEGTIDTPPPSDCQVSVPMTYVATPQPHLQANLGPMATDLPGITGLVLLPDASKITRSDTWRVVFSAHTRTDAAKTAPAKLTVTYEDGSSNTSDLGSDPFTAPVDTPAVAQPGTGIVSDPGTGFAAVPQVQAPATTAVPPAVSTPDTGVQQPVSQPQLVTVGYAYPAVWLLPLGFLILIPLTVRALTKDLGGTAS